MKTHKGEIIEGARLKIARAHVGMQHAMNAQNIYIEDQYAKHIDIDYKINQLKQGLIYASEIIEGKHDNNFTVWQRMNAFITGEYVPLLPNEDNKQ